jgi:uncharacterized membrane protein YkoI
MKKLSALLALLLVSLLCLGACNGGAIDGGTIDGGAIDGGAIDGGTIDGGTIDGGVAKSGMIKLKVNPEIYISYDADGNVTEVTAGNEDAQAIIDGYTDYVGKPCKTVLSELVSAIGAAGYFTEELEGNGKKISIDVAAGSYLPEESFVDDMTAKVLEVVEANEWVAPIEIDFDDDDASETEDCIGAEKAFERVLEDAGATVEEISRAEVEFDGDDGKATYEIEFIKDGIEYEYTVDAITGEILDVETELDDEDDDEDDDDEDDDDEDDDDDDDDDIDDDDDDDDDDDIDDEDDDDDEDEDDDEDDDDEDDDEEDDEEDDDED